MRIWLFVAEGYTCRVYLYFEHSCNTWNFRFRSRVKLLLKTGSCASKLVRFAARFRTIFWQLCVCGSNGRLGSVIFIALICIRLLSERLESWKCRARLWSASWVNVMTALGLMHGCEWLISDVVNYVTWQHLLIRDSLSCWTCVHDR